MEKRNFIASAVKHPGALHRTLHVPDGEKIPAGKIEAATHSDDPHVRKMANLAQTFARFSHHHPKPESEHGKYAHAQNHPEMRLAHHASGR